MARTDPVLIAAALRGEVSAFATIVVHNNDRLYRTAYAILRDRGDAEDAVQQTYFNAYKGLSRFRGDARLSTWLTRIVVHEAIDRLSRRRRAVAHAEIASGAMSVDETAESPDWQVARQEIRQLIERAVAELPSAFRDVFRLRAFDDLTVEQTAARLGIPGATVKTRHHRAKRLLRRMLGEDLRDALGNDPALAAARCSKFSGER